jgi:hypothetical protein
MLLRYAMILVDAGFSFDQINSRVKDLNEKIPDKLDDKIEKLMIKQRSWYHMVSVAKAIAKK